MELSNPKVGSYRIELFVSGLGSVVCFLTTYLIWRSLIPSQEIWLLPGIYFIELMVGAAVCFLVYFLKNPRASTISWIYSGILAVFIVLASFSVGIFYTPVLLIFAGLSLFSVIRRKEKFLPKLGIFLCAGLIQFALMLVFIWVSINTLSL